MLNFIGTCVGLKAEDIFEFDDSAREIKYSTFRKYLGKELIAELNHDFGVPLHRDWSVSFEKGKWKGKPAVCLHHSGIHHIWEIQ
jgi:hypothetical protein